MKLTHKVYNYCCFANSIIRTNLLPIILQTNTIQFSINGAIAR